jgi:hypothetical protein
MGHSRLCFFNDWPLLYIICSLPLICIIGHIATSVLNKEAVFLSESSLPAYQFIRYYNSHGYNMKSEVIDELSNYKLLKGEFIRRN